MCMTQHTVTSLLHWNWEGDEIIHESIVPSSRPVVGIRAKKEYDIDVREFLVSDKNEVMKRTIKEDLRSYVRTLPWAQWSLFESRSPGAFDHRADIVASYVYDKIKYRSSSGEDPWLFPDETLTLKNGDCEDRSFLLASLLLATGISPYNIRVALGKVKYEKKEYDHVWVMYKNEAGLWTLLEPLLQNSGTSIKANRKKRTGSIQLEKAEYEPQFLFNDSHLWAVKRPGSMVSFKSAVELRRSWKKLNPKFAGQVHQSILKEALRCDLKGNAPVPDVASFSNVLNSYFHSILGNTVDNIDSPRKYNPLEHFDNGLIDEGWTLVNERIKQFREDQNPFTFSLVAHAVADFYAHSSYAHFAPRDANSGNLAPAARRFSPNDFANWKSTIKYSSETGFDLGSNQFSINTHHWQGKLSQRPVQWAGKIISGRYAQADDSDRPNPNIFYPAEVVGYFSEISCRSDWDSASAIAKHPEIACAPHHNEIAVDEESPGSMHILYKGSNFKNQFNLRRNTAVLHIRELFFNNWKTNLKTAGEKVAIES